MTQETETLATAAQDTLLLQIAPLLLIATRTLTSPEVDRVILRIGEEYMRRRFGIGPA